MKVEGFIRENTWLTGLDVGWGNGYVVLPPEHRYAGMDYDDITVEHETLYVHGGLTFASLGRECLDWPEVKEEWSDCWIIGFDTAHYSDTKENWPKEAVQSHTDDLVAYFNDEKFNINKKR